MNKYFSDRHLNFTGSFNCTNDGYTLALLTIWQECEKLMDGWTDLKSEFCFKVQLQTKKCQNRVAKIASKIDVAIFAMLFSPKT